MRDSWAAIAEIQRFASRIFLGPPAPPADIVCKTDAEFRSILDRETREAFYPALKEMRLQMERRALTGGRNPTWPDYTKVNPTWPNTVHKRSA